jgi:hypothetical protein
MGTCLYWVMLLCCLSAAAAAVVVDGERSMHNVTHSFISVPFIA